MNESIKIAIVDDHRMVRDGLSRLLSDIKEYEVVISAQTGKELLQKLDNNVHILLTDVSMPDMDGFALTPLVRKRFPNVKIIAISMYDNPEYIIKLFNLGVSGYLLKDCDVKEIQEAINKVVIENDVHFTEVVSKALLKNTKHALVNKPAGFKPTFSAKEMVVIQYLCEGLTAAEVGLKMNISPNTVNGHKDRIMNKMNVNNIVGIVTYAYKNNIVAL
jgi:DNA-binding NarL/FixJ family response regulator